MNVEQLIKHIETNCIDSLTYDFEVYEIDEKEFLEMKKIDDGSNDLIGLPEGAESVCNVKENHMTVHAMYGVVHHGIKYNDIYIKVEYKWAN